VEVRWEGPGSFWRQADWTDSLLARDGGVIRRESTDGCFDIPTDMPTQHNSPIYKDDFPKLDAAAVRTLRHAGALIFGEPP
jgi:hypothetical protein